MNAETLNECTGCGIVIAGIWAIPLTMAMGRAEICTPLRQAAFLAQVAHESNGFAELEEDLDYSAKGLLATWPDHFTAKQADTYAHHPMAIANRAYANRMGNGDEESGDGWRFRGRGPMQETGRYGYGQSSNYLGVNLILNPDLLLAPEHGAMDAAWEWNRLECNALADSRQFNEITERINGGQNGATDRWARYECALKGLAAI